MILRILLGSVLVLAAIAAVLGPVLVWLGLQPTENPHGGAFAFWPGIFLLAVASLLVLAGWAARAFSRRAQAR